jgi:3-phenylpropionate/cinnamic acid dioxygenase small subunit
MVDPVARVEARPMSPAEVTAAITQFLYEESAALDERRHEDWLSMITDDYQYVVPVPMAREDPELPRFSESSVLAWESKSSLEYRFERMKSEFAWAERPPPFLRHFVDNVQVAGTADPGEWLVKSNLLVVRSRMPEPMAFASAGREDVIRGDVDGGFRLARRTVYLDTETPTASQLGILY